VNVQDVEKTVVFPHSQDECFSVASTPQEGSACNQPYNDGEVAFDEENQNDHDDLKGPEVVAPRFSRQMPQMAEYGVPQNSLDDYYLTYSGLPSLAHTCWSYRSTAIFSPEDLDVSYARDVTEKQNDHDDLKGPEVVAPRLGRQLPQMRENGVPQDSLNDYYLTYSVLPSLSDSFWPYRSTAIFSLEDVDVSYARDVTKNYAFHEEEEGQDLICSRYSRQMPQMGEYGVPQNSLDDYYLTYSGLPSLSDSFWPYRSTAIFSPEDLDVSYARDVTENLADLEDEENQDIISSSMEQLVVEENEIQPDSLDECYLASSIGHHLEGSCHSSRSVSFPTEKREIFLALDVNGDTCEDSQQEPVSFPASELPTSQAQLQKSTHVTECLQWQLDQHLDCGDSKPILGLCSTNRAFTTNPDSGNQGPLFLKLDASIRMKNPPKLEGEGSTASTHEQPVCKKIKGLSGLKQKILSRKVLFGKWRLAFRFPGLQA
ncbi:unnamed protein product, partial [Rangifer tarandus platyrhynchus]